MKDYGLICRDHCHKRIKWKDLDITYEMRTGDLFRVWWCSYCETMLKEDNMTDLAIVYELRGNDNIEEW